MKKVRNILVLSLLLLSVISLGSVSGTYAKYISAGTMSDEARVAQWGIVVEPENADPTEVDLFKDSYIVDGITHKFVESNNVEDVVAPGTKGSYTAQIKMAAAGTIPEVNYKLVVEADGYDDVGLIKYALDTPYRYYQNLTMTDLLAKLNTIYENKVFAAGTPVADTITIEWEWEFGDEYQRYEYENISAKDITDTEAAQDASLSGYGKKPISLSVAIVAVQTQLPANA